jgi:hypothetical protein
MKKPILISMILLLTQINMVKGQCIADAGQNIVVCCDWNGLDTLHLGGNPTASGGVPPYTYIWETEWQVGSWTYTASDFLNDTTIANPSVINSGENLTFYLTVIDSESTICTDYVHVDFTNFGTHLGYVTYTIQQGDSIYLTGMDNVSGGFPPFEYLWRPNHGLTDSTSLSFWAKPDSSVAYYLTLTDSSGCSATGAPVYFVNVTPVSIEQMERVRIEINVYPNPSKEQITIKIKGNYSNEKVIEFTDSKGQIILKKEIKDNTLQINSKSLNKGLNFYKIKESGKFIGQGKIIVD